MNQLFILLYNLMVAVRVAHTHTAALPAQAMIGAAMKNFVHVWVGLLQLIVKVFVQRSLHLMKRFRLEDTILLHDDLFVAIV